MQQTHELTSSQLHLVLERGLEVELHPVDGGLSRTPGGGNCGSTAGRAGVLAWGYRVHAELGPGGTWRHGPKRLGPGHGEIERFGATVFPQRCLPCQAYSSTGGHGCVAGRRSWGSPRRRVCGDCCADHVLDRTERIRCGGGFLGARRARGIVTEGVGAGACSWRRRRCAWQGAIHVLGSAVSHGDNSAAAGPSICLCLVA